MNTYKMRVRPYFMTALKYLEWKRLLDDVSNEDTKLFVLDEAVLSVKELLKKREVHFHIIGFKGQRHDQRFSLSSESNEFIREFAEKNYILIAEALELILYVYCEQVLTQSEMKENGLLNWNFKVEWKN